MYSFGYRLNTLITFASVLVAVLCALASFSDSFSPPSVHAHAEYLREVLASGAVWTLWITISSSEYQVPTLNIAEMEDVYLYIKVIKINRFRKQLNGNDEVSLKLNVSIDFESMFTWNTKQVFVFLAAEYQTPKNSLNQVSLWDHIIPDKRHAKFKTEIPNKYLLIDQGSNLRGNKIELVLHWHVMPKTSRMIKDKMSLSHFQLPDSYT